VSIKLQSEMKYTSQGVKSCQTLNLKGINKSQPIAHHYRQPHDQHGTPTPPPPPFRAVHLIIDVSHILRRLPLPMCLELVNLALNLLRKLPHHISRRPIFADHVPPLGISSLIVIGTIDPRTSDARCCLPHQLGEMTRSLPEPSMAEIVFPTLVAPAVDGICDVLVIFRQVLAVRAVGMCPLAFLGPGEREAR